MLPKCVDGKVDGMLAFGNKQKRYIAGIGLGSERNTERCQRKAKRNPEGDPEESQKETRRETTRFRFRTALFSVIFRKMGLRETKVNHGTALM